MTQAIRGLTVALIVVGLMGCGQSDPQLSSGNAVQQPSSRLTAQGTAVFQHPGGLYTQAQINDIKTKVQAGQQPWKAASDALIAEANQRLDDPLHALANFNVPPYYDNPAANEAASAGITADASAAYVTALAYRLTGNVAYANKAEQILNAWASTNTAVSGGDGPLYMAYKGTGMVFAAELLAGHTGWTAAERTTFTGWLRNVFLAQSATLIATRSNNWGDWGNLAALAAAHFLDDSTGVANAVTRLRTKIDTSLGTDGRVSEEVSRGDHGIWYSYFALTAMTAAAQLAYNVTGENLFQYTSPSGKRLEKALDYLLNYLQNPVQWPHSTAVQAVPTAANPWGHNLFEVMSDVYGKASYASYAAPRRPIQYISHHFSWSFPTVLKTTVGRVANPGFEAEGATQTPSGWRTSGYGPSGTTYLAADYTESNLGAHGGTYHGTHSSTGAYEVYTYQTVTGLPDGTYTLRAWIKAWGGTDTITYLEAKAYNAGGGTALRTTLPNTSVWTQISVPNIVVRGGQATIGFYSKAGAGRSIHFDDVELIR